MGHLARWACVDYGPVLPSRKQPKVVTTPSRGIPIIPTPEGHKSFSTPSTVLAKPPPPPALLGDHRYRGLDGRVSGMNC